MRSVRLKPTGWLTATLVLTTGCVSGSSSDFAVRGQIAVPFAVIADAVPQSLLNPPALELPESANGVFARATVKQLVPLEMAVPMRRSVSSSLDTIRVAVARSPEEEVSDSGPRQTPTARPVPSSGLPESLAVPLTLPPLPPKELVAEFSESTLPKLKVPDVMPSVPEEPTSALNPPSESVVGVPEVGSVLVGGQPVAFERLAELVGGREGVATRALTGTCSTCGGGAGGNCQKCEPVPAGGLATRVVGGIYQALCCPDPCYQPKWIPLADTAFFTPSARPVTHTRLRWEYTRFGRYLDRGEYIWARADGNGKGPRPLNGLGIPRVDSHELMQYTETAAGPGFSAYVATPYRSLNIENGNPSSAAGFGDMSIGTKSVLFDSELFLLTLQFQTTLPLGNAGKGLGAGHVSLEPSLIFGLRVSPQSFLQGQIAQWIPIAGDPTYSGAMLHYHLAYNHVLWQPLSQVQLIGTMEMHGFSWQDGGFTDPARGFRNASGSNVLQMGPGLRMFYCDKFDFGVGSNFGVTGTNAIGQQFRFEMRFRF